MTTPDLWRLNDNELAECAQRSDITAKIANAEKLCYVTEILNRGVIPGKYPTPASYLTDLFRITFAEANKLIRLAKADLPAAKAAAADGELDLDKLAIIDDVVNDVRKHSPAEKVEENVAAADRILTEAAATLDKKLLRGAGNYLANTLNPDGTPPKDDDPARDNSFLEALHTAKGCLVLRGEFTAVHGAKILGLIEQLATKRTEGCDPDTRNQEERTADALIEIIDLAAKCNDHTQGGDAANIHVTLDLETLKNVDATQLFVDGIGAMSPETLRQLACDARIIPIVLGGKSEALDVGRSSRLATTAQRRALEARDRGCAFPGCHRTAKWTTAHHIQHWAHGGATDLANMVLLCTHHHKKIHHSEWSVFIRDGLPWFIPPAWLDVAQQPIPGNTAQRMLART
jgi:hypothetical protein